MPTLHSLLTAGTPIAFSDRRGIVVARFPDIRRGTVVGQGQDPSLSLDGGHVAFEETVSGAGERHFVVRDARTGKRLGAHPGTLARFSPDGAQIAFSRFNGSKWLAWTIDAGLTGKPRPLVARGFAAEPPAFVSHWNADGTLIAYSETVGGALYALRPDGTVVQTVAVEKLPGAPETAIPLGCAWSGDLRRLVIEASTTEKTHGGDGDDSPVSGLYLYDLPAKRRTLLTPRGLSATNPLWYDADTILFVGAPNRPHAKVGIYAQSIAGGTPQLLVPKAGDIAVASKA